MRFSLACTAAFVASLATANPLATRNQISWEFPESMSVAKRQDVPAPGTPAYLCHENCGKSSMVVRVESGEMFPLSARVLTAAIPRLGTSITLSREAGYCTNYLWISRYDACLQCANTHNIWQYYSNSITASAAACGFTAVPV